MHRLASQSIVRRFQIAAWLFILKYLFAAATGTILSYGIATYNRELTTVGMGVGLTTILGVVLQWLIAQQTRCPLCVTPVLVAKACSKHRNARRFLGSYRLRAALSMVFRGWFRCPYCHEPCELAARSNRRA